MFRKALLALSMLAAAPLVATTTVLVQYNGENNLNSCVCANTNVLTPSTTPVYATTPVSKTGSYTFGLQTSGGPSYKLNSTEVTLLKNRTTWSYEVDVWPTSFPAATSNMTLSYDGKGNQCYLSYNTVINAWRWVTDVGLGTQDIMDFATAPTLGTCYHLTITYDNTGTKKQMYWSPCTSVSLTPVVTAVADASTNANLTTVELFDYYPAAGNALQGYLDLPTFTDTAVTALPTGLAPTCTPTPVPSAAGTPPRYRLCLPPCAQMKTSRGGR